jgi:hypothetical protein
MFNYIFINNRNWLIINNLCNNNNITQLYTIIINTTVLLDIKQTNKHKRINQQKINKNITFTFH